ncbi:MBL fold metallo-hydrolase [Kocuria tytonicola]|uniref:MBL fold metallo-hydrolase n=1 Tax=Kocuria tytonicola TaxID=2055946 RepID=A0A3L9LYS6_9MICC|nr:MBL fold metallo-hydrolase [Kocuria tytonicola]RLY94395.1 MBL fold metallo-hydrolase [Kocuria tytonicola]RLZ04234.1 MBL fold metallo-hydrolase [Kocuria tytonicola]
MFVRDVAPGIHMVQSHHVNCYLLEDEDGLTLVDAGLPRVWNELGWAVRELGRTPADLKALVLTHAHFDHVGVAAKLVARLGIPVHAHQRERHLAAHPYSYAHESPAALYPLRHPRAVPVLASMLAGGAAGVRGVAVTHDLAVGETVPVPGRPRVVLTAGHTYGHCALHVPAADAVLSGDALVTLDPYTGLTGPRVVAGAATADAATALESLGAIAATGARTVLPGHGDPWRLGATRAAEQARANGVA